MPTSSPIPTSTICQTGWNLRTDVYRVICIFLRIFCLCNIIAAVRFFSNFVSLFRFLSAFFCFPSSFCNCLRNLLPASLDDDQERKCRILASTLPVHNSILRLAFRIMSLLVNRKKLSPLTQDSYISVEHTTADTRQNIITAHDLIKVAYKITVWRIQTIYNNL